MRWSLKRKVIFAVFILGVIPIILNFILKTTSVIGIVDRSDVGAWFGYYAAVLGGSLTLLGVYATIEYQNNSQQEDKAIQFKPILELVSDSGIPDIIPIREIGLNVQEYSSISSSPPKYISINEREKETFVFVVKNKGRGETSNAVLKGLEVTYQNIDWSEKNQIYSSYSESYIGEIVSNEYCKILLHLPKFLLVKKSIDRNRTLELNTIIKIHYNDMFNRNSYAYNLYIRFLITLDERDYEEVSMDYLAVRTSYCLDQIMPQRENHIVIIKKD